MHPKDIRGARATNIGQQAAKIKVFRLALKLRNQERVDNLLRYCYCGSIAIAVRIAVLRFVEMSLVARLKRAGMKNFS